jgi:hypothetical protein
MYVNDAVMNLATKSGAINSSGTVKQTNKPTNTTSGGIKQGVALPLKRKVEETGKQMVEKKPTDSSVYNISTREKDVLAFDPNKKITDSPNVQTKNNLFENKYVLYGGIGLIAIGLIYFMTQD